MKSQDLFNQIQGLDPKAWICLGEGLSKEDVKALALDRGVGLSKRAITDVQSIAEWVVTEYDTVEWSFIGDQASEYLLREVILKLTAADYPEIFKLKRKPFFLKKLRRSFSSVSLSVLNWDELVVIEQRLDETFGSSTLRAELKDILALFWAELYGKKLLDKAQSLRRAYKLMDEYLVKFPQSIYFLHSGLESSLAKAFIERISHLTQVHWIDLTTQDLSIASPNYGEDQINKSFLLQNWHTPYDAAYALASELKNKADLSKVAVLIPDLPEVRRILDLVLKRSGLFLADLRDPQWFKNSEWVKHYFHPLKMVAFRFKAQDVALFILKKFNVEILDLLHLHSVQEGLYNYKKILDPDHFLALEQLSQVLGHKTNLDQLQKILWDMDLSSNVLAVENAEQRSQILEFFKKIQDDLEMTGISYDWPALSWWTLISERLMDQAPPPGAVRALNGLDLRRLQSLPVLDYEQVHFFMLEDDFFTEASLADLWWNDSAKNKLSVDFDVLGYHRLLEVRKKMILKWLAKVPETFFYTSRYWSNGAQKPEVKELSKILELRDFNIKQFDVHPLRLLQSPGGIQNQEVVLSLIHKKTMFRPQKSKPTRAAGLWH